MQPTRRSLQLLGRAVIRLLRDGNGQDLAEYGISLAVIGTSAAVAAFAIRRNVVEMWIEAARVIRKMAAIVAGS